MQRPPHKCLAAFRIQFEGTRAVGVGRSVVSAFVLGEGPKQEARRFLEALDLFVLAESLGGVESLIEQPFTMTHVSMPEDVRRAIGITEDLIRVSVGIEHADDLIADLEQALEKAALAVPAETAAIHA